MAQAENDIFFIIHITSQHECLDKGFDKLTEQKFYKVLPSPQIALRLLLISIVVSNFDIKIKLFKSKE